jgi:hypothetical protein
MGKTATLVCIALLFMLVGCSKTESERSTPVRQDLAQNWPSLPATGFVSGRAATKQDNSDGNAVFVAERDGKTIGVALTIEIPQYAVHADESGARTRVVVIQAERAEGIDMVGYRTLTGQEGVGMLAEFELLGKTPKVQ